MAELTYERAHELFRYEDGKLFWRVNHGSRSKRGERAGSVTYGYRDIKFNSKKYKEHRVIWLMHHGSWPQGEIDHIDLDKSNNRIENLRIATRADQMRNRKKWGKFLKGVSVVKNSKKKPFQAKIKINGKDKYLGCFPTETEAHDAYCRAAKELHGEFFNSG